MPLAPEKSSIAQHRFRQNQFVSSLPPLRVVASGQKIVDSPALGIILSPLSPRHMNLAMVGAEHNVDVGLWPGEHQLLRHVLDTHGQQGDVAVERMYIISSGPGLAMLESGV